MTPTTLMLVEDNPDDVELTLRMLKRHHPGVRVQVAQDGVEALDQLHGPEAEQTPLPALVLLDLNMPRMGGLEVLRRIRSAVRTRLMPVVVLTTSGQETDIQASYLAGANSFVRKPVAFEAFEETVRMLGNYWLGLNLPPPA